MDLNLRGGGDPEMRYHSSSPTSLSSPPSSSISNPASPSRLQAGRANIEMDEIVVDTASGPRFGVMQPPQPPKPDVPLTVAGLPKKKPGRKPGSTVKPKTAPDGSPTTDAPKVRKPRKPKDPNAPPVQRKRKNPPTQENSNAIEQRPPPLSVLGSSARQPSQPKIVDMMSTHTDVDGRSSAPPPAQHLNQLHPNKVPKFMSSILNRDPSPPPQPSPPVRMAFDPVRSSNYDPVRETMVSRDPYGTAGLGSPRGAAQMTNRASASPSISSLVDPPVASMLSPSHTSFHHTTQSRFQEPTSVSPSPSNTVRKEPLTSSGTAPMSATIEIKKSVSTQPMPTPPKAAEPAKSSMMATISGLSAPSMSAPSKKVTSVIAQNRKEKKVSSSSSSPMINSLTNTLPDLPSLPGQGNERSILDFGKANPGEEFAAPSIVLHIPLNGETNKYINFMRLAEESYGWDALHPRLAAHRERKARIAAASAALEKQATGRGDASGVEASGREASGRSDDEMTDELSDPGDSNVEMGGMGNGIMSGPEGVPAAKPARKKRNFKEDEYDREDDFVDDSEMMWEEQAAASKDGFFVYSGPLVPEVEKPPIGSDGPTKRGRGGRRGGGPGSRGGRVPGEGGPRRGGGPGSRGGAVTRKPRITKLEKQQLENEKAEREKLAQLTSKSVTGYSLMQGPPGPTPATSMVVGR